MTTISTKTMPCPIYERALKTPHKIAIETPDRTFSYEELNSLISKAHLSLQGLGIHPGHRVLLFPPKIEATSQKPSHNNPSRALPSWELLITFFALLRVGAIAFPLPPDLPQVQLKALLKELQTPITPEKSYQAPPSDAESSHPLEPKGCVIFGSPFAPSFSPTKASNEISQKESTIATHSYATLFATSPQETLTHEPLTKGTSSPPAIDRHCPLIYLLTSGSKSPKEKRTEKTGSQLEESPEKPIESRLFKISVLCWENFYYSAMGSIEHLSLNENNRWLLSLPLYHVGGLIIPFRTFLSGATLYIDTNLKRTPLTDLFYREKISHSSLVEAQLYHLLQSPHNAPPSLKLLLLGGGSVSPSLYEKGIERNFPLTLTYGMTEMTAQITCELPQKNAPTDTADTSPNTKLSSGYTLPHRELRINSSGEIQVRGKCRFLGYIESGVLKPLEENEWFSTGDMGFYSQDKGLLLTGRKDRQFISGGENIHPEEIEKALLSVEGVYIAHVEAKQDEVFGCRPIAYLHRERNLSDALIFDALKKQLSPFKIPKEFIDLPPSALSSEEKMPLSRWIRENMATS